MALKLYPSVRDALCAAMNVSTGSIGDVILHCPFAALRAAAHQDDMTALHS
jgi:hypothetical protein